VDNPPTIHDRDNRAIERRWCWHRTCDIVDLEMGADADSTLPRPEVSATGATDDKPMAPGAIVAERYRIVRFVASGAMGEIHAADDLVVGRQVAIKTLRPELERSAIAIERLRREIGLARKVTHPNVCRLHDVGEHAGRVFLTMELVDGDALSSRIASGGALSIDDVDRIARQLVDGLAALHAVGIVHRDFKTANVIATADRVVITDFGLARSLRPDRDASLTAESSLLGTPAYMSPEQVEGREATPASDIYALGVVLFELLTGRLPFTGDTALATATSRLHRDPPAPSASRADVPPRWDAIVARCLARDPAARFARVEDVLAPSQPTTTTRRWIVAGALAGAGAAAFGAWQWLAGDADGRAANPPIAIADGDLVAVLPPGGGDIFDDPLRFAIAIDLHDALAATGLPLISLDGASMMSAVSLSSAYLLSKEASPVAAAFAIPRVTIVVETAIAVRDDQLAVDIVVRRDAAGVAWRRRLTRPPNEVMLLVVDAAAAIAGRLGVKPRLPPNDARPLSPTTYLDYGAGLVALMADEVSPDAPSDQPIDSVVMVFERWKRLDAVASAAGDLSRAHAWVAERLATDAQDRYDGAAALARRAIETANRALAVDPDQPVALAARGRASMQLWDWNVAEADTRRAVEIAPTHGRTTITRGYYLHLLGRFDEGATLFEGIYRRNPISYSARAGMGWGYYFGRKYQQAIDHLQPMVADDAAVRTHGGVQLAVWLVQSYAEMSRFDDAFALAERVRAATNELWVLGALVPSYILAGRADEARRIVDRIGDTGDPYFRALALDAVGRVDEALALLEHVVDSHSGFACFLKVERLSPAMRTHPRFQALIGRIGFPA
jgi:tRNA A-37 threonylcarbamoyl transferase component Bud32/tetratricopeptide (TPR) repeat protein